VFVHESGEVSRCCFSDDGNGDSCWGSIGDGVLGRSRSRWRKRREGLDMMLKSNDGLPLRAKVFIYGIQKVDDWGSLGEILVFPYFERISSYKVPSVLKEEVDVTSKFVSSMSNQQSILKLNSTYHRQKRRWGYGIAVCRSDNPCLYLRE